MKLLLLAVPALLGGLGCTPEPTGSAAELPKSADTEAQYSVETVASDLEIPWALVFLPNKDILVTERPGRVRILRAGKLDPKPALELSDVVHRGEGGLMDLELHPDFAKNGWIYVSYVSAGPQVRVMRYTYRNGKFADRKEIIAGIEARVNHAGCRNRFGPDGKLYITTGEGFDRHRAQDLKDLGGKTLRLNDDGTIPEDNPFVGSSDAAPEIWSYGHRNAQGIDWDPATGLQWQSEHGPSGEQGRHGDEVNIVEKGKNYGWPTISHDEQRKGLESPIVQYTPAIAPGDAQFYSGKMFPQWKGNLFVTGLRGECLIRLTINGRSIVSQDRMFEGTYGRIRTVMEAPDGSIYLTTSNQDGRGDVRQGDDKILRITKKG